MAESEQFRDLGDSVSYKSQFTTVALLSHPGEMIKKGDDSSGCLGAFMYRALQYTVCELFNSLERCLTLGIVA